MDSPVTPDTLPLDQLALGSSAEVESVDWGALEEPEAARLRNFGFDRGVMVEPLYLGPLGRDPLAVRVGRMTVAIRRSQARAVRVLRPAA